MALSSRADVQIVKRGAVTVEDGCGGGPTYTAGQAFEKIGGCVHRAINPGTEECEEYNVFINPQGTPLTVFIPNNERRCGPARNVNECKDGGWMNFNHPPLMYSLKTVKKLFGSRLTFWS